MTNRIVWLGRIGKHVVTVTGGREVTRAEAALLHNVWRSARVKDGTRLPVGDVTIRVCRSIA